jgi:hypothetical protein
VKHAIPDTCRLDPLEPRRLLSATSVADEADRSIEGGFAVTVNFQPPNLGNVDNTRADFGRPFGLRGNGLTYGWNRNVPTVDRDSTRDVPGLTGAGATVGNGPAGENQAVDERFDTFAQADVGDTWTVRVPDASATYAVAVVVGDPEISGAAGVNSFHDWIVEGDETRKLLEGRPRGSFPYAESYAYVEPDASGDITLRSGPLSRSATLAWVRVAEVEPLPAASQGEPINWTMDPSFAAPTTRAEGGGERVGDRFVLLGGFPQGYTESLTRVDVIDVETGAFTPGQALPPLAGRDHSASTSADGFIYWLTGHEGDTGGGDGDEEVFTTTAWRYEVASDTWERLPDVPQARAAGSAVVVGDRLHLIGGTDETNVVARTEHWSLDLSELDDGADWEPMPSLPLATNHAVSGVLPGVGAGGGPVIVVAGGETAHQVAYAPLEYTQVYDVNLAEWRLGTPMPVQISHANAVVEAGRLWLVGGQEQARVVSPNVLSYDPAADEWFRHTDFPELRKIGGLFAVQDGTDGDDSDGLPEFVYVAGDTYQDFWSTQSIRGDVEPCPVCGEAE